MKILTANGANMPALGLGTWQLRDDTCSELVNEALTAGYRHVDTAIMYENEAAVGEGVRHSGVSRSDVFVTTKVWHNNIVEGRFQSEVENSLKRLETDYVDLLLIHWPPTDNRDFREWARLLNDVAERGWARNIGVSNFTEPMLDKMVEYSDRPIACNQVENHPYLDQSKLRAKCAEHGIALIAYCPLYRLGGLFEEPAIVGAAERHSKTPAQIVLRWHVQHDGAGAIPKTATVSRLSENADIFDFELSNDELALRLAHKLRPRRRHAGVCRFESLYMFQTI